MDNNKKNKSVVVALAILLVASVSFTFAYFTAQLSGDNATNVQVLSKAQTSLIFNKGDDLSLDLGIDNVYDGAGNVTSTTNPSVSLSAPEEVTENYVVSFNINTNSFVYTTAEKTPELILTILDENDTPVTSVVGLSYVTQGEVSGFDITEASGLYEIVKDAQITANSNTVTSEWDFTLTFINLDTDQVLNTGKEFYAEILMNQGETVSNVDVELGSLLLLNNGGVEAIVDNGEPDYNLSAISYDDYDDFDYYDHEIYNDEKEHYGVDLGMYSLSDDYGTSYYFRGAVDNNWLVFGEENGKPIYWRIVRINGDGSIKLLYSGVTPPTEEQSVVMTGEGTQIGEVAFNSINSSIEYVGYMYNLGENHGSENDSDIKFFLDSWYENNLIDYTDNIADTLFCYDRDAYVYLDTERGNDYSSISGTGIGTDVQSFGGARRNGWYHPTSMRTYDREDDVSPILICNNEDDKFSVNESFGGNGELTYPIGLLTIDESSAAGLRSDDHQNSSNYLYTNSDYWLGSPSGFYSGTTQVFRVRSSGYISAYNSDSNNGVRPVINLNAGVLAIGTGVWDDPYIIVD